MNDQWWENAIREELDQGDIFPDIPFFETVVPTHPLTGTNMQGGAPGFMKSKAMPPTGKDASWLSKGQLAMGLLLNHGCDLDKPSSKRCMLVRVGPLDIFPEKDRDNIITQRSVPMMYLPNIPGHGDLVANLRTTASVPRKLIDDLKDQRIASMTGFAKERLGAQLTTFFTRR
jgi:hypothetical protein